MFYTFRYLGIFLVRREKVSLTCFVTIRAIARHDAALLPIGSWNADLIVLTLVVIKI